MNDLPQRGYVAVHAGLALVTPASGKCCEIFLFFLHFQEVRAVPDKWKMFPNLHVRVSP